jgi:hypothetical protein
LDSKLEDRREDPAPNDNKHSQTTIPC